MSIRNRSPTGCLHWVAGRLGVNEEQIYLCSCIASEPLGHGPFKTASPFPLRFTHGCALEIEM